LLENVGNKLEEFNNKIYITLENYEKLSQNIVQAVEVLNKETELNYELLENIVNNPNSSKFI